MFVNLIGGALIGLLAGWFARTGANEGMRLFLAVGVLGGFTTFSAYADIPGATAVSAPGPIPMN